MSEERDDELGYAPAAGGGELATTIHTASNGLHTVHTTIPAGDRSIPVYAAWPKGGAPRPVVLVLSEAFGLHEHIADIARRFAHEGYFAVAPDLMIRQGDPMRFDDVMELVRELLVKIPDGQVLRDLDACVAWAASNGGDTSKLAATGFCWGGRWTWLYAAHRPLDAAVAWYGIVDGEASPLFPEDPALFPRHPLELGADLKTPVLGLYGGKDEAIPLATIEAMQDELRKGSAEARASEIAVFPDAGHAFFADYRESYMPDVSQEAWERCLRWIADRTSG